MGWMSSTVCGKIEKFDASIFLGEALSCLDGTVKGKEGKEPSPAVQSCSLLTILSFLFPLSLSLFLSFILLFVISVQLRTGTAFLFQETTGVETDGGVTHDLTTSTSPSTQCSGVRRHFSPFNSLGDLRSLVSGPETLQRPSGEV